MNRDQKAAAITEIAAHIDESQAILAVDYRGISVPQVAELRARLRDADATFKVVKNSLTERAADKAGAEANADKVRKEKRETVRRTIDNLTLAARFFSETPLSFDQRHDRFTIALGVGNGEPIRLTTRNQPQKHADELLALARTLKVPFSEDLTSEKLIGAFVKDKGILQRP